MLRLDAGFGGDDGGKEAWQKNEGGVRSEKVKNEVCGVRCVG